jgi:hypothetical protein
MPGLLAWMVAVHLVPQAQHWPAWPDRSQVFSPVAGDLILAGSNRDV